MINKIQNLYIYNILFLLGCASVGPPSGGSADISGPVLLTIYPEKYLDISNDEKIIFNFNELIDPISVPSSIKIDNDIKYKLKIRGNKIIILPDKYWPQDQLIRINLSRKIKDYQKNMMKEPINIIFSTGLMPPNGLIKGNIIKYNPKNLVEVGLYKWPLSDSSKYIQKTETDEQGKFQFNGINNGKFIIGAIEGSLLDLNRQMMKKKYAINTSDFILISADHLKQKVNLLLSDPVERKKITSIEMLSQYAFNLVMDDNSLEYRMIDSTYKPGDLITINLKKENRLESYMLNEFSFNIPEIIDTLGPSLSSAEYIDGKFKLEFSEPIYIQQNAITFKKDTVYKKIKFIKSKENSIILSSFSDSIKSIEIWGELITDWVGNQFSDSLKIVKINRSDTLLAEKKIGGNILGLVEYVGQESIKIVAKDINMNLNYFADVVNKKFKLSNIPPGLYELWGYEILNSQNSDIYYSGLWQPYKRAAKFSIHKDTIDVRARWDVEGILIDFK